MITEKEDFNYTRAAKIDVSDGCVKCIWLERSKETEFDNENSVRLTDGENALIEFENGKKMIITNSEWASLNWL
ncbi:MAG TPA: hypothetical protein VMW01_16440 [Williamwhitmania sp.]|nr:hypothetical protein [Williamwhitmania sp.]